METTKKEKETPATKVCKTCGRELPAEAFGKHARSADGLQPICRECCSCREKGNPKYGRRKKDGTVSIPATPPCHGQPVRHGDPRPRPGEGTEAAGLQCHRIENYRIIN